MTKIKVYDHKGKYWKTITASKGMKSHIHRLGLKYKPVKKRR